MRCKAHHFCARTHLKAMFGILSVLGVRQWKTQESSSIDQVAGFEYLLFQIPLPSLLTQGRRDPSPYLIQVESFLRDSVISNSFLFLNKIDHLWKALYLSSDAAADSQRTNAKTKALLVGSFSFSYAFLTREEERAFTMYRITNCVSDLPHSAPGSKMKKTSYFLNLGFSVDSFASWLSLCHNLLV